MKKNENEKEQKLKRTKMKKNKNLEETYLSKHNVFVDI